MLSWIYKIIWKYTFLILDTCHLDALYLGEQGCEDPSLFFETRRSPQAEKFGKHWPRGVFCYLNILKNTMLTDHLQQADVWNPVPLPKFVAAVLTACIKGQI